MALTFAEDNKRIQRHEHVPHILWTQKIPDGSEVFHQVTWPDITHMEFKNCGMSEDATVDLMHRHSNSLGWTKSIVLKLYSPAKTWKDPLLNWASGIEPRKGRVKKLQDESQAHVVNSVKLSKEVGTKMVEDCFAGIPRYLQGNGKRKYSIWGQTTNPASKV